RPPSHPPTRAPPGASPDHDRPPPRDLPEQPGLLLAQPLRAPAEVGVTEEGAVLVEVLLGVRAPPLPVRPGRGHGVDLPEPSSSHTPIVPRPGRGSRRCPRSGR